ncbi:14 kDa phosphohistidine phosphatase-like isoform X2 [Lithobates pipiens]
MHAQTCEPAPGVNRGKTYSKLMLIEKQQEVLVLAGSPDHIFDKVNPEMQALGLQCKCLGGGKIEHNSAEKKIRVYGESTGYGRADHSVTAEKLRLAYKDYEVVWEDKK